VIPVTPLVLHTGVAHQLLQAGLLSWASLEVLLRLRNLGGRTAPDVTFAAVVASVVLAINLGFRAAHLPATTFAGGWAAAVAGLTVLVLGVALRTWAILTLGRFFKFVVVIQDGHRVISTGPYRLIRHPSYAGGLLALAGVGIALDSWLSILILTCVPLVAILVRIRVEETKLAAALGHDYETYSRRTRRLIPGLW